MSDKLKKVKQFLVPFIQIEDGQRKIKAIVDKFRDEQDFEERVTVDELWRTIEILEQSVAIKEGLGLKLAGEIEAIGALNEILEKKQNG